MEATGVYYKPFFFLLEARGLRCQLVNARDVKNVPSRPKTDKLDELEHVERVAAIDIAKASAMVCTRLPHEGKPGRRVQRTWPVKATTGAIIELAELRLELHHLGTSILHRDRGQAKTHVQHVLTAIAANIERLSQQEPADSDYRPRAPTAFQQYLDAHDLPRPIW